MKYIIVLADGMADYPIPLLNGKTPLEYASTPYFDYIASHGKVGLVKTVPDGMVPESDTANLAVLGYDPCVYSKGRSPLEAVSMGINLMSNQTALRANLVCLSDFGEDYADKTMIDHSAGEISKDEAKQLVEYCDKMLCREGQKLYSGVSYRNCLVFDDAPEYTDFSRPHDILGKIVKNFLPNGENGKIYREMMVSSFELLNNHPINVERARKGLRKANSLWFWSPGKNPSLPSFESRTGLKGSVICAVDLIKGIGKCASMNVPYVKGATGGCVTDYSAKAEAAMHELEHGSDFVYIHIEAPDECGHKGDINAKLAAIESIDEKIVGAIMNKLDKKGEQYKIAVLPDHPTPICKKTHTGDPVPFAIYDSKSPVRTNVSAFSEGEAKKTKLYLPDGTQFIHLFLEP